MATGSGQTVGSVVVTQIDGSAGQVVGGVSTGQTVLCAGHSVVTTGHSVVFGAHSVGITGQVVTAPAGLVVSSNAEVRLVDSTITAAETAIETRGMAVVDLKGTVTTGKRVRKGDSEINER